MNDTSKTTDPPREFWSAFFRLYFKEPEQFRRILDLGEALWKNVAAEPVYEK